MSDDIHAESIFVDSGAHTLYNVHVLKLKEKRGKGWNGDELLKPPVMWGGTNPKTDWKHYDLREGTDFRRYCDAYAAYIKDISKAAKALGKKVIWANIDAIGNPRLTWEIQMFFEKEHGVKPIPIVHCHTPLQWVDKYIETGRYKLMGVGGLGQGISRSEYFLWGDTFFLHICPRSNKRLPVIKTHGFAMTSWELICRWPWWSVDSATWVKLSAYGWIYIPRYRRGVFRFDQPPICVNFSTMSPQKKKKFKHYDNIPADQKEWCRAWLDSLGLPMGVMNEKGEMIEFGVTSHHRARSIANLSYLKELEESRPPWPHPLDHNIRVETKVNRFRGLGL